MSEEKNKTYSKVALIYWILYMIGLLVMGILYKNGVNHYNILLYCYSNFCYKCYCGKILIV
ncbi:MAG: hypothetical protein HFI87_05215 [Bacilli bacterium]|nr:hypothetical protein [Bacilli bacterium]